MKWTWSVGVYVSYEYDDDYNLWTKNRLPFCPMSYVKQNLLGLSSGSTASKVFFFGNETASELQLYFVDLKVVYGTVKNKTKKSSSTLTTTCV